MRSPSCPKLSHVALLTLFSLFSSVPGMAKCAVEKSIRASLERGTAPLQTASGSELRP